MMPFKTMDLWSFGVGFGNPLADDTLTGTVVDEAGNAKPGCLPLNPVDAERRYAFSMKSRPLLLSNTDRSTFEWAHIGSESTHQSRTIGRYA